MLYGVTIARFPEKTSQEQGSCYCAGPKGLSKQVAASLLLLRTKEPSDIEFPLGKRKDRQT
jgi:hypothetical protein